MVFYSDHEHPHPILVEQMTWQAVIDLFTEHDFTDCAPCPGGQKCASKKTEAFSPVKLRPGTGRGNANVEHVSMLVYDLDHLTRAELEGVCDRLAGLESILSSTHSHLHGGPDDNCVRIILPLARPLSPEEFRHIHREVRRRYQLDLPGRNTLSLADPSTKDLSRLYFLPTAPAGSEVLEGHERGALLDLDDLLANASPAPAAAPRMASAPPPAGPPQGPTDMAQLRQALQAYRPAHLERDEGRVIPRKELARRVLAAEPLVRPDERGIRDDSCHRLGKVLAYALPRGTSDEAVLELIRPSVLGIPAYEDDGEQDTLEARFGKVVRSYGRGTTERAEQTAAFEEQRARDAEFADAFRKRFAARGRKARERFSAPGPATGDRAHPSEPVTGDDDPEDGDGAGPLTDEDCEGWEALLIWNPETTNKRGEPMPRTLKNVDSNAEAILSYSPDWRGVLRYNEVTKDVAIEGGPLNGYENTPAQITSGVKYWLQRKHGLALKKNEVMDAIVHVAKMNSFDPVKDYLNGLTWGGEYVDLFLETYCGALTRDGNDEDITALVRRMSRCFLVGAVARALEPGCKMDTVLILEGDQGVKKSTMLGILGGKWFTDSPIIIGDKDSHMLAGRSWIAEMAELSGMRASDVDKQKAFFTLQIAKFRPPYGYAIEEFPRRCVFAGSTNDQKYMNDITGNRRYHPVWCMFFRIREAARDRDRIWADAVRIYKSGGKECPKCCAAEDGEARCADHRWWFTEAENRALEAINNQRLKSEFAEAITAHILKIEPSLRPASYTMYEVATEILGLPADRVSLQQGPIGRALKSLKFEKTRVTVGGAREVHHLVPTSLLKARRRTSSAQRPAPTAPPPPMAQA